MIQTNTNPLFRGGPNTTGIRSSVNHFTERRRHQVPTIDDFDRVYG